MSIFINLFTTDPLKAVAYEGGRSRYEIAFYDALGIAAPEDADFWLKGLNAFRDARKLNEPGKTLDQITADALKVASNGDKKRLKMAVSYFNNTMLSIRKRQNKMNRLSKWLWLAGAIVLAAIFIYLGILRPDKVFFFF